MMFANRTMNPQMASANLVNAFSQPSVTQQQAVPQKIGQRMTANAPSFEQVYEHQFGPISSYGWAGMDKSALDEQAKTNSYAKAWLSGQNQIAQKMGVSQEQWLNALKTIAQKRAQQNAGMDYVGLLTMKNHPGQYQQFLKDRIAQQEQIQKEQAQKEYIQQVLMERTKRAQQTPRMF